MDVHTTDRNTTNIYIRTKQASKVSKLGEELNQARDKRFNLKSTSTKEATSPLRFPQREDYHQEPLVSPNPHKGWVGTSEGSELLAQGRNF
jgi:hypothetical protein